MIGAAWTAAGIRPDEAGTRMAASLGLFAGHAAALHLSDHAAWCQLAAPRTTRPGERPPGWPPESDTDSGTAPWPPGAWRVLLDGAIDNADELADALDVPRTITSAPLYAHALARWSDGADARVVGNYAAITQLPNGRVRFARSPWDAPPLFWAKHGGVLYACSVPRPIFAGGFPRRLKRDQLAHAVFWLNDADGGYWYEGLYAVPQGSAVHLAPGGGGAKVDRWYDPHALSPVRLPRDRDYVDAAQALLTQGVRAALSPAARPGLLLSGGLDSALAAAEMLDQLTPDGRLRSYTFVPLAQFNGPADAAHYPSEASAVGAFARMHPRLDATFCDNADNGFDTLVDQLFLAGDTGWPSFALTAPYHGPALAAARDGCDWLFDASFGNATLSQDGRWAYSEFLRQGRWAELWRLARDEPGDTRPMWRRLAARSLLAQLPGPVRAMVRALAHGSDASLNAQLSFLRPEVREALGLDRLAARLGQLRRDEWQYSRREWLGSVWAMQDMGTEQHHATSQVYGLRRRDVMTYRPLVEFCLGLPTEQFVCAGEQRWLARRMAAGRLPPAQAQQRAYGRHNADWHLRMSRQRPAFVAEAERIAATPDLARLIDADAMLDTLRRWPAEPPSDPAEVMRHFHAVTGAILVARFWRFVSGSNR